MSTDPSILVAGETLIDFLPERPGSLTAVDSFDRRPGGAPANVAVGLARLGTTPLFWTRVGDDPFGHYLRETLTDAGLSDRYIEFDPAAKTTLAFVTHDADGDREFTFYRDETADTRLEPGRIDDETLASLEWVHVGGVTLASGPARAATRDLIDRAGEAGCTVSFDPNARPELWHTEETFASVCRDALEGVDVCKATAGELEALGFTGATPTELGQAVVAGSTGPHTAFVTRGSEGAVAVAGPDAPWGSGHAGASSLAVVETDGYTVETVDTTGAGDAFVAGIITALQGGKSVSETLASSSAIAAITTTETGAMTALPDRETVRAFRRGRS
ncbi:carbohydrate kinase [Natrialba sp. PRR66]|uniref:carbohydrate kinase family protein n=1 Tax=Natrialba sp. PRR66 TaxID=3098146 RepID=UPI002B1DBA59|nr:carbohydrate kinase [Natrialba sp. PRR66]